MKVVALTNVFYNGKEWLPGAEFEFDDGADLQAAIAVGKVKSADEQQGKPVAPMSTQTAEPLVSKEET